MDYNPKILPEVLRARSLTRAQLSQSLGVEVEDLNRELKREPEPKQSILNEIARELALPPFVFFMKEAPALTGVIPDFRSEVPAPAPKSKATTETIQFAEGVQKAAAELGAPESADLPRLDASQLDKIEDVSFQVRLFFDITLRDQLDATDARAFYVVCRKKIEDKGIFVLQDSFPAKDGSGFCLWHLTQPIIVINTQQQTRGRRLFTLIHELAHVLMHQSGISDPSISRNATERLCNQFAGSFLVPKSFVGQLLDKSDLSRNPSLDDIAWASRRLKISQEATVLRLEQLGRISRGSHEKWKRVVEGLGNPDFSDKGGGSNGPPPQEKVKLAKYGFRFAQTFDKLLRAGKISEINIYRSTGLKPKYQHAYFDYAKSISASGLQALALGDD